MKGLFSGKKILPEGSLSAKSWSRLRRNKTAVASMFVIIFTTVVSLLGYLIVPDSSPYANEQHLEIASSEPGFSVRLLLVRKDEPREECSFLRKMVYGCPSPFIAFPVSNYYFRGDQIVITPFDKAGHSGEETFTIAFKQKDVIYALHDTSGHPASLAGNKDMDGIEIQTDTARMRQMILDNHLVNRTYLLGTDRFGRDVLSQLVIGARVSLSVGFISVLISLVLGIILGSLSGFFRGRTDDLIIWFINVIWSVPTLLLVIAITFALGKGFWQVFIAVGLTMWVEVARVVRGQIMSIREKEFIEAARALGYKNSRIIRRHILPNTLGPVIVISAANFASAILIEAGLSFLGIGVQPPMPSWGTMVKENYAYIILDNPWLAILPGLCIMMLVLAFMLIGNGLRDALDVKATDTT